MRFYSSLLFILVSFAAPGNAAAEAFTIVKEVPFDILKHSHKDCEARAIKLIEQEAKLRYIGCKTNVSSYGLKLRQLHVGDRSVTTETCSVEATVDVSSKFLDAHDYYLGSMGVLCAGFDTAIEDKGEPWSSFELGMFVGLSGAEDEVKMTGDNKSIFVEYDSTTMVGLNAAYLHKVFDSQYIGAKLLIAKGAESFDGNTDPTASVRNDGNPSILRLGAGVMWGYRYHVKTDFSIGANYIMDSLTRTYTNTTYEADVDRFNIEAGAGYLILPNLKVWGTVASDMSANIGVSWVMGASVAK